MSDRTVHARLDDGAEIVRYDRAGKWRYENSNTTYRRTLSVREAVQFVAHLGEWIEGQPGGLVFDRMVRAKFEAQEFT